MKVLDSSAMVAYLNGEAGGEVVKAFVESGDELCAHAINLCEVFNNALHASPATTAEKAIATLKSDGIIERNDMDAAFWRDIALARCGTGATSQR